MLNVSLKDAKDGYKNYNTEFVILDDFTGEPVEDPEDTMLVVDEALETTQDGYKVTFRVNQEFTKEDYDEICKLPLLESLGQKLTMLENYPLSIQSVEIYLKPENNEWTQEILEQTEVYKGPLNELENSVDLADLKNCLVYNTKYDADKLTYILIISNIEI